MEFTPNHYKGMLSPNGKALVLASGTPKLPPKVAYTLLDLAISLSPQNKSLYDPFCGNGTILTMAGLNFSNQFKYLFGSDINLQAVDATRLNLATNTHLEDSQIISQVTSLDGTYQFPEKLDSKNATIITDPPFGRRCILSEGTLEKAFNNFFRNGISNISFCFDDKTPLPLSPNVPYKISEVYRNWNRVFYTGKLKK
jgi:tRNA G10  N-methylase Trm11